MNQEIHNLMEVLATIQGKNVDIVLQNESNNILMCLSTEQFASGIDEYGLCLIMDNNCHDCNFDTRIPLTKISNVYLDDFDEDGSITITLTSGLQYIINKI